jgi:hypothetical protein
VLSAHLIVIGVVGVALGVGVVMVDRWGPVWLRARVFALVGAVALGCSVQLGSVDLPVALVLAVAMLLVRERAAVGEDADSQHPLGPLAPALVVASLVGVWASVPDVEPALAGGACLTPVAIWWWLRRRRVGPAETAVLTSIVLAAAVLGSAGWPVVLAACATVGMVLVAPLVLGFVGGACTGAAMIALVVAHLLVSVPAGRLALDRSWSISAIIAAATLAVDAVVALSVRRWWGTRRRADD